ncbi:ABC transporter ATP-binding protein [Methanobrevibacter arboriphilus]|jgi:ATP-binding cassette subfamily B protein|uniref:ABC transporter ATP-binding protein n=1 Tax=Methanobrevibacter arboriphilus TaxID=39441 RepID=A0ACA8R3M0_METAZ|nr:ABC transporter ATP-binding protein [Methanobrevibacter arboriphilus]BBL61440.1 ABC transporter ATP-binding protein [Methanobrevibacter arboriphilus]GLI11229.1 ABC transporter ATP-binding protein [Methanobrevibacter arboriphilus]
MIDEYLAKKFALSKKGANNLKKGIVYTTLLDFSLMLPVILFVLFLSQYIPDPSIFSVKLDLIGFIILIIIVLAIIYILKSKQYHFIYNATYEESEVRRITLAEKLRKLPMSFFEKKNLSDLTTTIMGDCTDLEHAFSHAIPELAGSVISLVIISIGMLLFNLPLSIALLWVIPVSFLIVIVSRSIQEKNSEKIIKKRRTGTDGIQESIETIKELKAYNYEDDYLRGLNKKIKNIESSLIKSELVTGTSVISGQMVLKLGIVSVMIVGSTLLVDGQISLLMFILYLIAAAFIYLPIQGALEFLAETFMAGVKINRMKKIESQTVQDGSIEYSNNGYDITFKDVSFNYKEDKDILKNINFTAKQGEVTALMGPSGGGKSTISKLAARFWDANEGKITLGGVDLKTIDPEALLKNYAIVFQDVVLFNNTVKENIRIGSHGASDEEVYEVAKLARCDEFVKNLPDGYDTLIGENGSLLSGGERQRISIARALLKNAPIILLDEATASLDVENESEIQKALSILIKNKTVIVIAHRMRTIANVDKIVVLKEGKIVEKGSPQELNQIDGLYKRMVDIQNKTGKWRL